MDVATADWPFNVNTLSEPMIDHLEQFTKTSKMNITTIITPSLRGKAFPNLTRCCYCK